MIHTHTLRRHFVLIFSLVAILFSQSCKVTETESKYQYKGSAYIRYKDGKTIHPEGKVKVTENRRDVDNVHKFIGTNVLAWSDGKLNYHKVMKRVFAPMSDSGKINMYCNKDESYMYSHTAGVPNSGGWTKISSATFYLETGKDTLKEMKFKLLYPMIPQSSPSYKILEQYKQKNKYTQATTYGGIAMLLAGLLMASEKGAPFHYQFGETPLTPVQITGWGLVVGGSVTIHIGNKYRKGNKIRLINAVRSYNAEK